MRRAWTILSALLLLATLAPSGAVALLSKTYRFKPDVVLQLGAPIEGGLRLESIEFHIPSSQGRRILGIGGNVRADVVVSNPSQVAQKAGIAIALFDDAGRLLGVASGGSKLLAIKADRQSTYTLTFQDVNDEAHRATTFTISVELK